MKVGDLVKHTELLVDLEDWLGIIIRFDEDDDPVVRWFEKGIERGIEPEFRSQVKVI